MRIQITFSNSITNLHIAVTAVTTIYIDKRKTYIL